MSRSQMTRFLVLIFTPLACLQAAPQSVGDRSGDYFEPDSRTAGYVREALTDNPQLGVLLARYRAAVQRIPQVTSLPDPTLTFTEFLRSPETRVGPQTSSLVVSQRFPWFGKLDLEGKMAARDASAVYEQYRASERRLAAEVKETVIELAYIDSVIVIAGEERDRLDRYEQLATARYATGNGLQASVIRIQAGITRIDSRLEALAHDRRTMEARLNTLRHKLPEEPIAPLDLGAMFAVFEGRIPALEALYRIAEANRPELRAILDGIERSQLAAERARKDYWPDVTLSAGIVNVDGRRDPAGVLTPPPGNGRNAASVSIAINIPLNRDRYRAAELAAIEGIESERSSYETTVDTMRLEIREQVSRIEMLRGQFDLYSSILIPQADAEVAAVEAAYETDQVESLDLLGSQGAFYDIRLSEARMRADYVKAMTRLELALGTRFPVSED